MHKIFFIIYMLLPTIAISQNIVTDTVFIDFASDTLIPIDIKVAEVHDNRKLPPKFISFQQKKKYLLIPVDQEICTRHPLADELLNSLTTAVLRDKSYRMDINYFLIERGSGRFSRTYYLRADLPIYEFSEDTLLFVGTFSYNFPYIPPKKKSPLPATCETLLTEWHRNLKLDLLGLKNFESDPSAMPESFIPQSLTKPLFLNVVVGSVIGLDFWQLEAELYFSRPETRQNSRLTANIVRYQNNSDYEMFGIGKQSAHRIKRFSDMWYADVNANFIIGLNKWRQKEDKTLFQLVNFSLSSSQSMVYNKLNTPGWVFKAGLFENFSYIIETSPKLQVGVYLAAGYKF